MISKCSTKTKKHAFTADEDEQLKKLVSLFGDRDNWKVISENIPGRTQRQCRERYKTYLAPDINRSLWTKEEDEIIKKKYLQYGSRWTLIAMFLKGRSSNSAKNRFNNHINKHGMFMKSVSQADDSRSDSQASETTTADMKLSEDEVINMKPLSILQKNNDKIKEKLPPISFLDNYIYTQQMNVSFFVTFTPLVFA